MTQSELLRRRKRMQTTMRMLKIQDKFSMTIRPFSHLVLVARCSAPATTFLRMTSKTAIFKSCHRVPRTASTAEIIQQSTTHFYIATLTSLRDRQLRNKYFGLDLYMASVKLINVSIMEVILTALSFFVR